MVVMKWRQRSNIHGLLWSKLDGDTYVQVSWLLPSGSSQLNGLEIHIRIMFNEHEKVKLRHCTNKWKNSMEIRVFYEILETSRVQFDFLKIFDPKFHYDFIFSKWSNRSKISYFSWNSKSVDSKFFQIEISPFSIQYFKIFQTDVKIS